MLLLLLLHQMPHFHGVEAVANVQVGVPALRKNFHNLTDSRVETSFRGGVGNVGNKEDTLSETANISS